MAEGDYEWAGVAFAALHHHDGRMLKAPGLFGFVRRHGPSDRVLLFVDHADCLAAVAGPGHRHWAEALLLGMNELHINLAARERLDRLQLRAHLVKRCQPLLNLLDQQGTELTLESEALRRRA